MYDLDLEKQISIIIESLGKIDKRLERIEQTQEEHGQLLSRLVTIQEDQKDLIETLAIRTTEQDAEIRKIKRKSNKEAS